ncbi:hypothetical protein QK338_05250 [Acinetobacter ursingii]|uniref:hypothetical protein n=1 Tax=Acinetobacter ursingii TaxID=108980 RepID=UPI00249C2ADF|nr:hypothetical protein [Acinetobacter ursingii]MDI3237522.1 hypothetical protein [Acinetobacter ursingii]
MSCIRFPKTITAGITLNFRVNLTAYPASSGWSLVAYLRGNSAIDLQSQADGNQHLFNIPAEITKNYKAGHYGYSLRAIHSTGLIDEIESGVVEIKADLATLTDNTDLRSHAQKTLAAIEAVIENRATLDQERYRINNRELYRTPFDTLVKLRGFYRAEVAREQAKACGKSVFGKVIRVRLE